MGELIENLPSLHAATGEVWVKPVTIPPPQIIRLATVDQYVPKMWLNRILFFQSSGEFTNEQIFAHLTSGLSCFITEHPIFAGKLCRQPDNPQYAAVEINDNPGVQFIFRDHTDVGNLEAGAKPLPSYAQFKENGFPTHNLKSAFSDVIQIPITEGSCMLAVQANFVPGGLLLGLTVNHLLVDGGVFMELINRWALFTAQAVNHDEQSVDAVERSDNVVEQLSTSKGSNGQADPNIWIVGPADKPGSTLYLPKITNTVQTPSITAVNGKMNGGNLPAKGSSVRIWHMAPEKQKELKALANAWSVNDAIFALIWNRNVLYRGHRQKGISKCLARSPINIRARAEPPIPANHIGNAVLMLCTECSIDEVEGGGDPLVAIPCISQKYRETIRGFNSDYIDSFISHANSLPDGMALVSPSPSMIEPNILLNDHSKLSVYDIEWGSGIGCIQTMRDAYDDVPVRGFALCVIFPKLRNGAIEVITWLDDDVNDALIKDAFFMHYFSLYCAGWKSV